MNEFNVVPFLIGLIVAALLGLASGWLTSRANPENELPTNPLSGATTLSGLLFWVAFAGATVSGLAYISAGGFWLRQLLNILIAAIAFADVFSCARAVRVWHNKTLPVRLRARATRPATE